MTAARAVRALEIFGHVATGCQLARVPDARHWPHIAPGELVLIDPANRAFAEGELFLIEWQGGKQDAMQVTLRQSPPGPGICVMPLNRPPKSIHPRAWADRHGGPFLSEGPLDPLYLATKNAGRVIGLFEPGRVRVTLPRHAAPNVDVVGRDFSSLSNIDSRNRDPISVPWRARRQ